MENRFLRWLAKQQKNYLLISAVTFGFPVSFTRWMLRPNRGSNPWGDNACFTLSFDCDFPEDVIAIPSLLQMLRGHKYKVSFACVGHWIEKYPDIHKQILDEGHEIINHTYSHPDNEILNPGRKFLHISRDEKKEEIERCHELCWKILKYEPAGCRIPHFKNLFSVDIYSILAELNYRYSSSTWLTSTVSRGRPFIASEGIAEFPLSTCPRHPFTVFDTWHIFNSPRWAHRIIHRDEAHDFEEMFNLLIKLGMESNSYLNIYIDPLDIKKIHGFSGMLKMLDDPRIDVVTYSEYLEKYPVVS